MNHMDFDSSPEPAVPYTTDQWIKEQGQQMVQRMQNQAAALFIETSPIKEPGDAETIKRLRGTAYSFLREGYQFKNPFENTHLMVSCNCGQVVRKKSEANGFAVCSRCGFRV